MRDSEAVEQLRELVDDQLEELKGEAKPHFAVAVYIEGRAFGGPEEGGWWFTYGELEGVDSWHQLEELAYVRARELNTLYRVSGARHDGDGPAALVVQVPRRELRQELRGEMCHSYIDPVADDYVIEYGIPTSFPEGRPHYC